MYWHSPTQWLPDLVTSGAVKQLHTYKSRTGIVSHKLRNLNSQANTRRYSNTKAFEVISRHSVDDA